MSSTVSYSTTSVTVTACKGYLASYRANEISNPVRMGNYMVGNNVMLIKDLVSQMEEIIASGQSGCLKGAPAELLFSSSLFWTW